MKELFLFFSCLLCVSADVLHEDIRINGCSDFDGETMYGMEGDEKWYADFKNKRGVDALPDFANHPSFPGFYELAVANQEICRSNLQTSRKGLKHLPPEHDSPSSLMIYLRDKVEFGQKNTLICHVTGFYPAPVNVSWTKNEQVVTEGSSINVPFPNKDGTFKQISRLDFTPQPGDIYSCTVQHLALTQPLTKIYEVEAYGQSDPDVGPAVFCGVGLTVGLLGVAVGTFFLIKGNECS